MRVAVLGGGPAGAVAAARLAGAGLDTVLLDEKLAWEKPCGGGKAEQEKAAGEGHDILPLAENHGFRPWVLPRTPQGGFKAPFSAARH